MSSLVDTIYLFNTVLNIFSTTCTVLFLLYRFTSIFSYILGFLKFIRRLFTGCIYIKNSISRSISHNSYIYNQQNDDLITNNDSFFTKCKKKISYYMSYFFQKKQQYSPLPIYQTNISVMYDMNDNDNVINYDPITINQNIQNNNNTNSIERLVINNQIDNLIDETDDYSDDYNNNNNDYIPLLNSIQFKHNTNSIYKEQYNSIYKEHSTVEQPQSQENIMTQSFINKLFNTSQFITPTLQTPNDNPHETLIDIQSSHYSDIDNDNSNFLEQFKSLNLN